MSARRNAERSADAVAPNPVEPMAAREVAIEDLLGVDARLVIVHGPDRYLLRLTRRKRLLLTKEEAGHAEPHRCA